MATVTKFSATTPKEKPIDYAKVGAITKAPALNPNWTPEAQAAWKAANPTMPKPTTTKVAPVTPTPVETTPPVNPYDPKAQAKGLYESEMKKTSEYEKELFGESAAPTTIEEAVQQQVKENQRQKAYLAEQQQMQQQLDVGALGRTEKQGESAIATTTAAMAQSREAPLTTSKPLVAQEFKSATEQIIGEAQTRVKMAQSARDKAMGDLDQAIKTGNTKLAESIRADLAASEQDIRKAQTDKANAETQQATAAESIAASQEQRARQNVTTFQGIIESGVEMTPEAIKSMSSSLNIPFETAFDYYSSANQIRSDKSIDNQTKAVLLAQKKKDLQDTMDGYSTEKSKNLRLIQNMIKDGVPQDQIDTAMRALDIPTEEAYQADINYKNAQIKYQNSSTAKNYQDLLDAQAAYNDTYGDSSFVPTSDKYNIENYVDQNGNQAVKVGVQNGQSLDIPGTDRREDWCAAFVNDLTGAGLGDSYASKLAKASEKVPKAGMFFVQPTSQQWGHTGLVESVNLKDGTMDVVEANWQTGADGKGIVGRRTMKISDAGGFGVPQNASTYKSNGEKVYSEPQKAAMNSIDPTKLTETDKKTLKSMGLKPEDLFSYVSNVKKPIPEEKKADINNILTAIDDLEKDPGLEAAVGAGFQKVLTPWMDTDTFIPGTDAANFAAKFKSFRDNLTLPSLDKLKGAMSDKDIAFLRNASTSLTFDMDEKTFKNELNNLREKYKSILSQGTDVTPASKPNPANAFTTKQYVPPGVTAKSPKGYSVPTE